MANLIAIGNHWKPQSCLICEYNYKLNKIKSGLQSQTKGILVWFSLKLLDIRLLFFYFTLQLLSLENGE